MLFITAPAYCKSYKTCKHCFMPLKRKRTVAEEKKVFNFKWEIDYFMIETAEHTMMFLICSQVVKTMKGDNAKEHFRCHMSDAYAKLKGEPRKICVENLKKVYDSRHLASLRSLSVIIMAAKFPIEWYIILV